MREEVVFDKSNVLFFDELSTFSPSILALWEKIEEATNPAAIAEVSVHNSYKSKFEEFLTSNNVYFEYLNDDGYQALYLISYNEFDPEKGKTKE